MLQMGQQETSRWSSAPTIQCLTPLPVVMNWLIYCSKSRRKGEPDGKRLDRVQNIVHHAVLADRRRRSRWPVRGEAHGEQTIGFEQRAVGVSGLVGACIEQVQAVETGCASRWRNDSRYGR